MLEMEAVRQHMATALGLAVRGVERLGVTAYNRHYRVELAGGPMHLVVYTLPESLPLQGIRFEHAIVRHLRDSGFGAVPELFVQGGESLFRVGACHYALTEWIDGCHSEPDLALDAVRLAESARTLASLHRAAAGFTQTLDYFPEHIFVYPATAVLEAREALLERLAARVAGGGGAGSGGAGSGGEAFGAAARAWHERIAPRLGELLAGFDAALYAQVRRLDPTPVVHGDYRRINLVYGGDGRVKQVLDYNCCFNEVRLWDVAYSALSFGGRETVGPLTDPAAAAAFIAAYDAASPLAEPEWELLPAFLTFVVAKLMLAAVQDWWIVDRAETFERLLGGEAERIVERARGSRGGLGG
jgi:Ser/Thr protein kinase RdoA (MazF antagonist)